jgi:monovalent cation:H+ antiporter-2, CPA2 family
MVETARLLNPDIEIIVRTHSEDESELLAADGFGKIFFGEEELAKGMVRHIFDRFARKRTNSNNLDSSHRYHHSLIPASILKQRV